MLHQNRSTPAARPSDLKVNNRMQILELFKSGGVYSVADIAREIGVSRQTVMKGIQFFLEKGVLVSEGKADSGSMGGKRAELFRLSPDKYLFCVLIGPENSTVTLINFRCETIDALTLPHGEGANSAAAFVQTVCAGCERVLIDHGIALEDVRGLCVATTGVVGRDGTLCFSPFFRPWGKHVPLASLFANRLGGGLLVIVEQLGKVCGSAYMRHPGTNGKRVATLLACWDDISACLIDHGGIVNGKDDLAGELGHMTIAPEDEEVCICGSRGCFECQVSAARLRRLAVEALERFPDTALRGRLPDDLTIRDIFAASARGDGLGQWLSAYAGRHFSGALRNLALLFNPDRVVFQGDFAWVDGVFLDAVRSDQSAFKCLEPEGTACGPFEIALDTRPPAALTPPGAYSLLIDRLLSDEATFS